MLGFCGRRLQLLLQNCRNAGDSVTHLRFVYKETIFTRLYSSKSLLVAENGKPQVKDRSFTVSYLINSCGLSPELAILASKRVRFDTPHGPDSVLKLLKEHGLTDNHISIIVKKRPQVLLANVGSIVPKLEFLDSVGVSGTGLARLLCFNQNAILGRSLERTIIPCCDMLKNLHLSDNFKVERFFMSLWKGKTANLLSNVAPNVSILRAVPVPEAAISLYLALRPFIMTLETNKFKENVDKVIDMGFCPSASNTFMQALIVITEVEASERARKMEPYRKWGWSEADCLLAFRKNPFIVQVSEKKILSIMDLLVNKMGWQPTDVAGCPTVLVCSLGKWIKPRCSVIRILLLKGLIRKGQFSLSTVLKTSREFFLNKFVIKYQEQVPELLDIFQGKMALEELGLGFEE